jgi:hypothetical protein
VLCLCILRKVDLGVAISGSPLWREVLDGLPIPKEAFFAADGTIIGPASNLGAAGKFLVGTVPDILYWGRSFLE